MAKNRCAYLSLCCFALTADGGYKVGLNPTMTLLQEVMAAVDIPVIAAGGIMDGAGIRQVTDAGG